MPCQEKTLPLHHKRSASDIENEPDCFPIESPFTLRPPLPSLSGSMKRMKIHEDGIQRLSALETLSSFSSVRLEYGSFNNHNPGDGFPSYRLGGASQVISDRIPNTSSSSSSSSSFSSSHPFTVQVKSIFGLNNLGNNQLHSSILQRNTNVALNLIKQAPSFDYLSIENAKGQTALHLAVLTNQPTLVRTLICAGAAVDAVDGDSRTALHLACKLGNADVVQYLLRPVEYWETLKNNYKIPFQRIPQNMELTDADGKTCLELALENRKYNVALLLFESGSLMASPNFANMVRDSISRLTEDNSSSDESSDDGDSDDGEEEETKQDRMPFRNNSYGVLGRETGQTKSDINLFIKHKDYSPYSDFSSIKKKI